MRTMRAAAMVLAPLLCLAASPVRSEDAVASAGKERAAASPLAWEIREAGHPLLGPIRFAHTTTPVATPVGGAKVYSNAYVSCAKNARTIAIEVTNQTTPDDPGGLAPAAMPRLVCIAPAPGGGGSVQQVIAATWEVNGYGDAMARGLKPSALRACAAIAIVEDVTLPKGWARASQAIQLEIAPYARELDSIFATCGERSAYATAAATAAPARAREDDGRNGWKPAFTVAGGTSNVRAAPNIHSPVVARLDAGAAILVRSTGGSWWRAKSRTGHRFEGYIREDRLVFR